MNPNQSRTLWISVGSAFFAMMLIYSYSQEKKAEYDKKFGAMKRVVVAKEDIVEMRTIDENLIEIVEKPVEFIQPGALENPLDAVSMVAAAPIKKGEQILNTKLLPPGPNTGLALQVAPSKRAMTIPIDDVRGVSRLMRPGDRVDILTAIDSGGSLNRKTEVKTLMQDVPILATGVLVTNNIPRIMEVESYNKKPVFRNLRGDLSFSTVTVEVTPREAQDLIAIMATSPGSIYLTLRHPSDRLKVEVGTSNPENILNRGFIGGDRGTASAPGFGR